MGWIDRLCETYDACINVAGEHVNGEPVLIPVAHSTANAQIEVFVNYNGELVSASVVEKDGYNEVTIIPVTEDSATRTNGNSPHPLHDKLCYVAGDYVKYTGDDKRGEFYKSYMDNLKKWLESEYSCDYIKAVYKYLQKGSLIKDLLVLNILEADESGCLSDGLNKINNLPQTGAFIRFGICNEDDGELIRGWLDKSLYELYEKYYIPQVGYDDICFASGLLEKCTVKHPNKLRNSGDKAKLISGNDSTGFTFRGRFGTKEETVSVGYVASQKAHNALRWLIQRQGYKRNGNTIVLWNIPKRGSKVSYEHFSVPDVYSDSYHAFSDTTKEIPDTGKEILIDFKRAVHDYYTFIGDDSRIIMMSIDAATQGRMSIEYYHEFDGNEFLESINEWHEKASVIRLVKDYETEQYVFTNAAPSVREIALAAYGSDRGGYLGCDDVIIKNTVKRLLPCVTGLSSKIPSDIVRAVLLKVERPQSYSPFVWSHGIYPVAISLLKHEGYLEEREDIMEPNKERSFIWGKLLAVLDEIESRAMYITGRYIKDDRLTNAKKTWNKFVRKPMTAYEQIYKIVLQAYMKRLPYDTRRYFEHELEYCINRLQELDGFNNDSLTPEYLVGYHQQKSFMKNKNQKEN